MVFHKHSPKHDDFNRNILFLNYFLQSKEKGALSVFFTTTATPVGIPYNEWLIVNNSHAKSFKSINQAALQERRSINNRYHPPPEPDVHHVHHSLSLQTRFTKEAPMKKTILSLVTLLTFTLTLVAGAQASIIFNTLGSSGAAQTNITGSRTTGQFYGTSFDLTGATAIINSVTLNLKTNSSDIMFVAGIFSSLQTSNSPTAWVADLGVVTATTTTLSPYVFTPARPVNLAADMRYWIMLGSNTTTAQGAFQVSNTPSNSTANPYLSVGGPSRWRTYGQDSTVSSLNAISLTGNGGTPSRMLYALDGRVSPPAPVPEPSTYALFSLGLGGLALWKRRQRKA